MGLNLDISDLVYEVISQYTRIYNRGVPKTKLLKLVYLAEVMYKRRSGEKLTNAEWVYYLYGPYLWQYDKILKNEKIAISDVTFDDDKDTQLLTRQYLFRHYC
jgi:hypothetical protein